MKNERVDIQFDWCGLEEGSEDGTKWDLFINANTISEKSIAQIKERLQRAFELGMSYKAKQVRECLEIKERISLT